MWVDRVLLIIATCHH